MATAEMNAEGNQADDLLSPSEEDSPPVLNDTSAPLNFSELTPREFGISVKSFTPASLSNGKDKFRLAQIKSRRKSSIGARGSPETNSLIRFMAQQRMKTSSTFQTLELVRSSPFLPRVASTLRQKMASFQSLMDVEEREKKKSVRFGGPLSPEFFDKHLPPSTPLKKGGTPGRAATPCGSFQLCSVLKTPQRSEPRTTTTQARLDLSGLDMFGASPTLAMPRNRSVASAGEDDKDSDGGRTIAFPLMEEIDSAETGDTEYTLENQPVNLNAAFHEEFLSQILTESETSPSTISPADSLDEPAPFLEKENHHEAAVEAPVEAPARSRNQRKKHPGPEQAARSEPPAGCAGRKRKLPEESEPVKRSTRSAAKAASGRIKTNSAAKWRWNKDVDRSLYGSRAYASKNPNLSPITERLPLLQSQAAQQIPCESCTTPNHETGSNPQSADDPPATDDLPATNALEKLSGDPVTSPNSSKKQPLRKGRRQSGPRVKRNGAKKRRVAVPNEALRGEESLDQTGRSTEELCEEQTTTDPDASSGTPLTRSEPEQGKVDAEHDAVIPAETLGADCPGSGAESDNTLSQSGRRTPRRGSVDAAALRERENRAEAEQGEQAASRQENLQSSSGGQEGTGVADFHLAPWQADFNFEDVFKPVPARLQRSVRRSLRNRSAAEQGVGDGSAGNSSVGLAWLAWTSPDSNKESRRKTRGRRLSAAPAVLPALPEGNAAS
uniref:PP1-binding domain-containing protein n=1 Tax=Gasterosteus aculeatus aculeatus TaxID=481459 RepID=A0AAQ4NT91_GASAC